MPTLAEVVKAIDADLETERLALLASMNRVYVARLRIRKATALLKKLRPLVETVAIEAIEVQVIEGPPVPCPECARTFETEQGMHHHQTVVHLERSS